MVNTGESVHPQVSGFGFDDARDSAWHARISIRHGIKVTARKHNNTALPREPNVIVSGCHRYYRYVERSGGVRVFVIDLSVPLHQISREREPDVSSIVGRHIADDARLLSKRVVFVPPLAIDQMVGGARAKSDPQFVVAVYGYCNNARNAFFGIRRC